MDKNQRSDYFRDMLYENFPKLKNGGGFKLLRSSARVALYAITMPPSGYSTNFLSDESGLGGAICYIRPMQEGLSLEQLMNVEPSDDCIKEQCKGCSQNIQIVGYVGKCSQVCQRMCEFDQIENHAATCGETNIGTTSFPSNTKTLSSTKSMSDVLEEKRQTIEGNEAQFSISVVRRLFIKTAMGQLMDSLDDYWMKPIRMAFIGEKGVDAGGLTREFFTLLFKTTTVYDADGFFTIDSQMLQQKKYCLLGKAILNGRPGPHALNKLLAGYILTGKEPNASDVQTEHIHGGDIQNASSETVLELFKNMLGFFKKLVFEEC
ncbi:hypothetical protein MAR_005146 [Mya arenaria]|uniref:HECT domain-containing protein n=1 Tax=Mya arenaria TaxID=6604 RepID=A0ABY7F6W5_MYAAR|nr:hypothetical protein MAR_005146 [Mya arenaria]